MSKDTYLALIRLKRELERDISNCKTANIDFSYLDNFNSILEEYAIDFQEYAVRTHDKKNK